MTFTLVGPRGSDTPTAVVGESWRSGGPYDVSEVPLLRFPAATREAAVGEFHRVRAAGIRAARAQKHGIGRDDGPWRMKGSPYYLDNQAERLGLTMVTVRNPRVHENKQLHKIGDLLGQLQREYWKSETPRLGYERKFSTAQVDAIRAVLDECESEVCKLHAMAGASDEMVAEASEALGMDRPPRDFRVVVSGESPAESVEVVAPPAITDEEIASLRSEIDRLRAENESLAERPTGPDIATSDESSAPRPTKRRPPAEA